MKRSQHLIYRFLQSISSSNLPYRRHISSFTGINPQKSCAIFGVSTLTTLSFAYASAPTTTPPHQSPQQEGNDFTAQWRVFTDVAKDLVRQNRHSDAEKYLQRALHVAKKGFGEDDPHVASAYQNLAEVYRLQHKYDLAEPLYDKAIAILFQAYGPKDIRVAFTLHNLAGFYFAQKKLDKAAQYYEQSLQVKLACVGPGHNETSNSMFHLAEVRWAQGMKKQAIDLFQRGLESMEQQTTSDVACTRRRTRLAEMYVQESLPALAEPLLRKVVESTPDTDNDSGTRAAALENLSKCLQEQGKCEESKKLLEDSLAMRERWYNEHQNEQSKMLLASSLRKLADAEMQLLKQKQSREHTALPGRRILDPSSNSLLDAAISHAQNSLQIAEAMYKSKRQASMKSNSNGINSRNSMGEIANDSRIGWLSSWLSRPTAKQSLNALKKVYTVKPEMALLEYAAALRTASAVHSCREDYSAAEELLQIAESLLFDEWKALVMVNTKSDSHHDDGFVSSTAERSARHHNDASVMPHQRAREKMELFYKDSVCSTLKIYFDVVMARDAEAKDAEQKRKMTRIKKMMKEYGCCS